MSINSLAALRKNGQDEIARLAEEHMQHDLQDTDRDALKNAASKLSTRVIIGSLLGVASGVLLAYRVRSARTAMFNAFRAQEKPTKVQFADGRTGKFTASWKSHAFSHCLPMRLSRYIIQYFIIQSTGLLDLFTNYH